MTLLLAVFIVLFAASKIVAVGYGENPPVAYNSTPEGKAKNRRIDIIIMNELYDNLENK